MDLSALREDFPLFAQRPELVYLDSAATSQKPRRVIEALRRYYETLNANVHRGAYRLSAEAPGPLSQRRAQGDRLCAQHHRGHEPGGLRLGP